MKIPMDAFRHLADEVEYQIRDFQVILEIAEIEILPYPLINNLAFIIIILYSSTSPGIVSRRSRALQDDRTNGREVPEQPP